MEVSCNLRGYREGGFDHHAGVGMCRHILLTNHS